MSTLRDAAALFVEAGKALGRLEQARENEKTLSLLLKLAEYGVDKGPSDPVKDFADHRQRLADTLEQVLGGLDTYERLAHAARDRAAALVDELERPGTVLARRLVATVHGARAAWRGSR